MLQKAILDQMLELCQQGDVFAKPNRGEQQCHFERVGPYVLSIVGRKGNSTATADGATRVGGGFDVDGSYQLRAHYSDVRPMSRCRTRL
jgi:hypothetical protein